MTLPATVSSVTTSFQASFDSAKSYAAAEKSEATRRAYAADWRHFQAWADTKIVMVLPASIEVTASYLADLADSGLRVATINRRAAAIAYVHRRAGLEPPTSAEPVKAVLRGIRRSIGSAVTRKAPMTAQLLAKLLKRVPDTLTGSRDRALILIGFAAALRRSELVALRLEDIERTAEGIIIHIRRSKTDQDGEGHQVAVPRGTKLRPVEALERWLELAGIVEGRVFDLTPQMVGLIVKRHAAAAKMNVDLFSGHSLRAGFVTSALEAGADLLKVMDVTRHREVKTLKIYDRRAQAFRNHAGKGFL